MPNEMNGGRSMSRSSSSNRTSRSAWDREGADCEARSAGKRRRMAVFLDLTGSYGVRSKAGFGSSLSSASASLSSGPIGSDSGSGENEMAGGGGSVYSDWKSRGESARVGVFAAEARVPVYAPRLVDCANLESRTSSRKVKKIGQQPLSS